MFKSGIIPNNWLMAISNMLHSFAGFKANFINKMRSFSILAIYILMIYFILCYLCLLVTTCNIYAVAVCFRERETPMFKT